MTSRQAAQLYQRAGQTVPTELAEPQFEKVANTKRKSLDGIIFRSTLEAECYKLLSLWQRAGAICGLECQPKFVLQAPMRRDGRAIRAITYTADFRFIRDGRTVVVDAKGWRMDVYRIKRKMFLALFPDLIFEEWDAAKLKTLAHSR